MAFVTLHAFCPPAQCLFVLGLQLWTNSLFQGLAVLVEEVTTPAAHCLLPLKWLI